MKKFITNISIGLSIGFTCNTLFVSIFQGNQTGLQLISVWLMSALIGLISNIFYNEKLSLLAKTMIQLVGSFVLFFITAIYNQWFDFNAKSMIFSTIIFLIVFLIIWICAYLYEKQIVKKINDSINQNK